MLLPTVIVIVEVPDPGAGIGLGLKLTVVPDGAPDADRLMALLKPLLTVVVIVEVPWLPCWIVRELGEADIVKSGGGGPPHPPNFSDASRVLQSNDAVAM